MSYWTIVSLACLVCLGCAEESTAPVLGWSATDVQGVEHRPLATPGTLAVVLIFTMQDCPIANGYVPELNRLHEEFAPRGVRFYLVHTDPEITADAARTHAKEYEIGFPVLLDAEHRFVRHAGATRTPEAALFSADGQMRYRGRIDDRYADYGKRRAEPTSRDLKIALKQLLAGQTITRPRTSVVGCHIPTLTLEDENNAPKSEARNTKSETSSKSE